MFELVEKIKTLDGQLFDSKGEAEAYIVDQVSEGINEWIKKTNTFDLKYRDLVLIITELAGDAKKLKRMHDLLSKYIY